MYPTLYHAFLDLFGLELQGLKLINTFGFLVALAFLGAARTLASELDRKYQQGKLPASTRKYEPPRPPSLVDVSISGFLAFLLGFFLETSLGLIGFWWLEISSLLFVYMLFSFFLSGHMFPLERPGDTARLIKGLFDRWSRA